MAYGTSEMEDNSDEDLMQSIYALSYSTLQHNSDDSATEKAQPRFGPGMWKAVEQEVVSTLPSGIDVLCKYKIVNSTKNKVQLLQTDGRKWKKSSVSNWKDHGNVRYADCRGSHKCVNNTCPFRVEYGVVKRTLNKEC